MSVRFPKILVVDDNEAIRSFVSKILIQMGIDVSAAENGEKGMDLLNTDRFDLVITDFDMPGINWIDLANEINRISPATLIVLMTGYDKKYIFARMRGTNVDRILHKPFSLAQITKIVRGLLNQTDAHSPQLAAGLASEIKID